MASGKRAINPLLAPAVSGFSLSESFGPQAAVLVPSVSPAPPSVTPTTSSSGLGTVPQNPGMYMSSPANFQGNTLTSSQPPASFAPGISPINAPPTLKPPPPGVFLLTPQGTSGPASLTPTTTTSAMGPPLASPMGPPPTLSSSMMSGFSTVPNIGGSSVKRSPYVPPPGIKPSASTTFLPTETASSAAGFFSLTPLHNSSSFPSLQDTPATLMAPSHSYDTSQMAAVPTLDLSPPAEVILPSPRPPPPQTASTANMPPPTMFQQPIPKVPEVAYHWFYKLNQAPKTNPLLGGLTTNPVNQDVWKPFTMIDSMAIEQIFALNPDTTELIPTDGGRYDVNIRERIKTAVFWKDELNSKMDIRRCSWFYNSNVDGRWVPFDEELSSRLEREFVDGVQTGRWNRRLELDNGEYIALHSESVIVHFPSKRSTISGSIDDWGQVQPPTDPALKPREVHRGLEGLPEIPDGESSEVDHLVFIVHGIGSVCDMSFRSITEVVDGFRELADDMSQKHFQSAHLSGRANRVEFLPVSWHRTLHGEDTGTDERLRPLTLRSIPKLRSFVNETLLDILFYTSPIYCQTIIDTVVTEINRMYTLFMARNENFQGQVSIIGHSLGSLIVFDILSHQLVEGVFKDEGGVDKDKKTVDNGGDATIEATETNHLAATQMSLEQVFSLLEISEFAENFTKEGIDMDALLLCSEDDLKEGGLPLGPRKKLIKYLENLKSVAENTTLTGLEKYQKASIESEVKYIFGPAGTGQPSVHYPRLLMNFSAFYALGSPLGMFLAVRGIDSLGTNFSFPTCPKFYNIFHPFDPVAYRVEGLIKAEYGLTLRPLTIPHHKGRKRMHLELKDTVTKLMSTDIKQKLLDSFSAAINAVYSIAVGNSYDAASSTRTIEQAMEQEMEQKAQESDQLDSQNPIGIDSMLNGGKRIDYALQEAPLESFNEYLFALASHLCYWESEDTCLMILKDIYSELNIVSDDQLTVNHVQPAAGSVGSWALGGTTAAQHPPPIVPYLSAPVGKTPYVTSSPAFAPPPPTMTPGTGYLTSSLNTAPANNPPPAMFKPSEVMDLQASSSSAPPTMLPPVQTFPSSVMPPPAMPAGATLGGSRVRPAYPKPVSATASVYSPPAVMGMDPTAPPAANDRPIAPPPMAGFVRKQ